MLWKQLLVSLRYQMTEFFSLQCGAASLPLWMSLAKSHLYHHYHQVRKTEIKFKAHYSIASRETGLWQTDSCGVQELERCFQLENTMGFLFSIFTTRDVVLCVSGSKTCLLYLRMKNYKSLCARPWQTHDVCLDTRTKPFTRLQKWCFQEQLI